MLTAMTEEDWTIVLRVFAASRSRRGDKGRNDRKFLEALHYFVVHNIATSLPSAAGLDLAPACERWSCDGSDCNRSEVMLPRQASQ
jgi:hypothetical protein